MPPSEARIREVREALAAVNDPELDESVVALGFIADVAVNGDAVDVAFRLPTFWCSAGFAWIMAEDMHAAVRRLPWVAGADIRLVDHFAADRVNSGVAAGAGFHAAFGAEAAGDLAALRETFRRKAFLGRMSALIEPLRRGGMSDTAILALRIGDLAQHAGDPALGEPVRRYLELRSVYGGASGEDEIAFRTPDGAEIPEANLQAHLRHIRMTRRSVEANGEMCRILLKGRNEGAAPLELQARQILPAR